MASKKAVVAARMALIGIYKGAAEEALPKEQLNTLYRALKNFTDPEVAKGVELFIFEQETVWRDGQSIHAVIRKFCEKAHVELKGTVFDRELLERERDWNTFLNGQNPEDSAIGRHALHLLAESRVQEAVAFKEMDRKDQLEALPEGAVKKAGDYLCKLRRSGPPPNFQLPSNLPDVV